jgi:5-methylcytosine-specific restriction protein A
MTRNRFWDETGKAGRLYGRQWQKARAGFLAAHPLCRMCSEAGVIKPANVVDHIIPHRGDERLFWDRSNWQPLCAWHHNSEKAKIEIRGYSRRIGEDGWPLDPHHPTNGGAEPISWRSRPEELKPIRVPVFLVVGAPGSGKSSWCAAQMQADDVLIDFDRIDAELNGPTRRRRRFIAPVLRERNARLMRAASMTKGRVFFPTILPMREHREWWRRKLGNVTVVMIDADQETCIARMKADATRALVLDESIERAREWHRTVERDGVDILVNDWTPQERGGGGSIHSGDSAETPIFCLGKYLVSGSGQQAQSGNEEGGYSGYWVSE